jgi:hypothetical protein
MGRVLNLSRLESPASWSYIIVLSIGFPFELVRRSPAKSSPVLVRIHIEPDECPGVL